MTVELRRYNNSWYDPGRSILWRALWMFIGLPLFKCTWFASSAARVWLLRIFGARVGDRIVIRQNVSIKYPWKLIVGDDCWIGENAWIDNLATVTIGSNVCVSQGAYLCTGNHDWSDPAFGLRVNPIIVCDGAWVGAKAIVLSGVIINAGAVATAGSVVTETLPENTIAGGNPAKLIKRREIRQPEDTKHFDVVRPLAHAGELQEEAR